MKSDIDKIDEQIKAIQNAKKKTVKKVVKEESPIPTTDTKKLDKIEDAAVETVEAVGDTKKMDVVEAETNLQGYLKKICVDLFM